MCLTTFIVKIVNDFVVIQTYDLWMLLIWFIILKTKTWRNCLHGISGLSPFGSSSAIINKTQGKDWERKFLKITSSLWFKHMEQSCLKYCHDSFADNSFHSRVMSDLQNSLTDYFIQNGCWKLSALGNTLETYKYVFI